MLKIKMHEFIVAFMNETKNTSLWLSTIKEAIRGVAKRADIMLYEDFDNTLENIVEVVLTYPEHFELDESAHALRLVDSDNLEEYVKHWPVPVNVSIAIHEYWETANDPMVMTSVDMDMFEQNQTYICKDPSYINWLWDFLKDYLWVDTNHMSLAKNATDAANITRLFDLYIILSRYYSKNLMASYKTETKETFIFHYTRDGVKQYFSVSQELEGDNKIYRAMKFRAVDDAPYFSDVAFDTPCVTLHTKKELLKECKELFEKLKNIDVRYEVVKDVLDKTYGKNISDYDD